MNIRKEACRKLAIRQGGWTLLSATAAGWCIELMRDVPEVSILWGLMLVGNAYFGMEHYAMMKLAIAKYHEEEED